MDIRRCPRISFSGLLSASGFMVLCEVEPDFSNTSRILLLMNKHRETEP